jgi:hypothetical protein
MRRIAVALTAVAVVGVVGLVAAVRADEEKVPLDKVPAAVLDAAKKRFPKAELTAALKIEEKGKTHYEIQLKQKRDKYALTLTATGVLQEIEKEIPLTALPEAVTDALAAKYPKATIKTAEEIVKVAAGKERKAGYTIGLAEGTKSYEVVISSDGKTIEPKE